MANTTPISHELTTRIIGDVRVASRSLGLDFGQWIASDLRSTFRLLLSCRRFTSGCPLRPSTEDFLRIFVNNATVLFRRLDHFSEFRNCKDLFKIVHESCTELVATDHDLERFVLCCVDARTAYLGCQRNFGPRAPHSALAESIDIWISRTNEKPRRPSTSTSGPAHRQLRNLTLAWERLTKEGRLMDIDQRFNDTNMDDASRRMSNANPGRSVSFSNAPPKGLEHSTVKKRKHDRTDESIRNPKRHARNVYDALSSSPIRVADDALLDTTRLNSHVTFPPTTPSAGKRGAPEAHSAPAFRADAVPDDLRKMGCKLGSLEFRVEHLRFSIENQAKRLDFLEVCPERLCDDESVGTESTSNRLPRTIELENAVSTLQQDVAKLTQAVSAMTEKFSKREKRVKAQVDDVIDAEIKPMLLKLVQDRLDAAVSTSKKSKTRSQQKTSRRKSAADEE
ncbi:hypothetical protein QBC47DRAFT_362260 [Echria macrotheca]|uniref:Uncharacterized protein n=1 Tax=Echria macrotheca TaxID=438768 RepID=A0AAJ0B7Z8_9PEZI|nr:hypothetical protein QBC47DRAFT_362260 [Echria macrotheca]